MPVVNVEETLLPAQFLLLSNSHGVARCRCPCRTFSESSINTRHDMQVCMEEKQLLKLCQAVREKERKYDEMGHPPTHFMYNKKSLNSLKRKHRNII